MRRRLFEKSLDVILEDVELFAPATEALGHLDSAKLAVGEAEINLRHQIDALNNQLALQIRHGNPMLNINMSRDGNCIIRYRNSKKCLILCADPRRQCFTCGESSFERRFRRYHGHALEAGPDVLGRSVADFFKQNYRSIR